MKLLSRLQVLKNQTMQSQCAFQRQSEKIEECDSGMASDEENPEMQWQAVREALQKFSIQQSGQMQRGGGGGGGGKPTAWQRWVPQPYCTPRHSSGPLHLISLASDYHPRAADLRLSLDSTASSDQESLQESSDLEQSSLDLELDSSLEFEQKCLRERGRDMSVCAASETRQECAGTSDEEVSELLENLPHVPIGHTVRRRHSSGALSRHGVLVLQDSTSTSLGLRNRKRHFSDGSRESTVMHRPCLDFEKMQKNVLRKPVPHGVNKVRIVKVKTFSGSCVIKPTPVRCDPSHFSFQPIVRSASPATPMSTPVDDISALTF